MRAEIVSVGTELLLGTITDTNASYLARRLAALGIDCYHISEVGDNLARIVEVLKRGWDRSDLVVTTGGLGPTQDDLTREAAAEVLAEEMSVVPELEKDLRAFFARRHIEMPASNLKQAALIPSAAAIPNPVGTAPGWWIRRADGEATKQLIAMPGVPYEMKRMWEREVEPQLERQSGTVILSRTLKVLGLGESAVEAQVADLMNGSNPTLAPYAKRDGIHLRITAKAPSSETANEMIGRLEQQVRERLGTAIYGADDETPQAVVRALLAEMGYSLVLLEAGPFVAGAVSPLTIELQASGHGGLARGSISVPNIYAVGAFTGNLSGERVDSLESAVNLLRAVSHADIGLGVQADVEASAAEAGAAIARARVCVVVPGQGNLGKPTCVEQMWKTDPAEIRRLVGLAAYNMLRLRLLKHKNREQ